MSADTRAQRVTHPVVVARSGSLAKVAVGEVEIVIGALATSCSAKAGPAHASSNGTARSEAAASGARLTKCAGGVAIVVRGALVACSALIRGAAHALSKRVAGAVAAAGGEVLAKVAAGIVIVVCRALGACHPAESGVAQAAPIALRLSMAIAMHGVRELARRPSEASIAVANSISGQSLVARPHPVAHCGHVHAVVPRAVLVAKGTKERRHALVAEHTGGGVGGQVVGCARAVPVCVARSVA